MSGGIQANTDKTDPQWIHSGEPGTSGREPFEDDSATGVPAQHNHERQHGGLSGGLSGSNQGYQSGATGSDNLAGLGSDPNSGERGIASSGLAGATTGHHHHHHQQNQGMSDETLGRTGVTGESGYDNNNNNNTGAGLGEGRFKDFDNKPSFGNEGRSDNFDRVGNRNEGGAMYERTGNQGPATSGAAGTDRFDTDNDRSGAGVGRDVGTGAHRGVGDRSEDSAYERTGGGELGAGSTSSGATTGTGGGLSGLTTSDNEFTGKDRSHTGPNVATGAGAYEDTSGPFKGNTSGPGGNTALTGREGTTEKNPVAQSSSTGAGAGEPTGRVGQEAHATEHKGFVQKIKDML